MTVDARSARPLLVALVIKTNEGGAWILPQIAALRTRGHRVVVVLPPGPGRLRLQLEQQGVEVRDSPHDFRFTPRAATVRGLYEFRRLLSDLAPDVVFYHLYASALTARLSSLGLGTCRVHMVAGPLFLDSTIIRNVERVLARLDHRLIAGSEHTRSRYEQLGVRRDRLTSIPYGVDTSRFVPATARERAAARTELGLPSDGFVAAMVAYVYGPKRLAHRREGIKGHEVLLRAWQLFRQSHPDATLLLVGSGFDLGGEQLRRRLQAEYGANVADSQVVWLDSSEDVRVSYAAADVSVCPSLSENHGAALESGAAGLPLIVSDAGGLPETVTRDTGWLVPRGEASALAAALTAAYADWRADRLTTRGELSRKYILATFDQAAAADRVADAVETAAHAGPQLTIFTESRFGLGATGRWQAQDSASGAASWQPYLSHGAVTVAARCERVSGSADVPLGTVEVRPLPYYVGVRGLVRRLPALCLHIARAVRSADVVIVRVPGAIGTIAAAAARALRRSYVVEVVGDAEQVLRAGVLGRMGSWAAPVVRALYRWQVRGAVASLFVTQRALQQQYPPRSRTPTAGISRVALHDSDYVDAARSQPPRNHRVIAVGSHDQLYKGHDVLLHALARLCAEGVEVSATIVGRGRRQPELLALRDRLGLTDCVHFAGQIDDRVQLRQLLDEATVFACPSLTEGLPRALVEAMARALPAVGTTVGGIPELLDEAALVRPGDATALARALRELMSDDDLWRSQSELNLARARQFHSELLDTQRQQWLREAITAR